MHFGCACLLLAIAAPAVSEAQFQLDKLLKAPGKAALLPKSVIEALLSQTPWSQNRRAKKKDSEEASKEGGSLPPRPSGCRCNTEAKQSEDCIIWCLAKASEDKGEQKERGSIQPGNALSGKPLTDEDWSNAKKLKNESDPDAYLNEMGDNFEGDIDLAGKTLDDYKEENAVSGEVQSSARVGTRWRWPNAEIPYEVDEALTWTERARIADAILAFHDNTCLRLVPRCELIDYGWASYWSCHSDYVVFIRSAECSSPVGYQGGAQSILTGPGCSVGNIQHEIMHAAGFFHEQSRTNRDAYVTVNEDNILPGYENNFAAYGVSTIGSWDFLYDYGSIMHYGTHFFSRNNQPTIETNNGASIGQRYGFSQTDINKINKMYCGACVDQYSTCYQYTGYCGYSDLRSVCCNTCQ